MLVITELNASFSGMPTHAFPGGGRGLPKIGAIGGTRPLACSVVPGLTPILFAALGSRSVLIELPRPNAALQ
jgi:hypothetical protein